METIARSGFTQLGDSGCSKRNSPPVDHFLTWLLLCTARKEGRKEDHLETPRQKLSEDPDSSSLLPAPKCKDILLEIGTMEVQRVSSLGVEAVAPVTDPGLGAGCSRLGALGGSRKTHAWEEQTEVGLEPGLKPQLAKCLALVARQIQHGGDRPAREHLVLAGSA